MTGPLWRETKHNRMIIIKCQKELDDTVLFATEVNALEKLASKIHYLECYADPEKKGEARCTLYHDFAPHSFAFTIEKKLKDGSWSLWFNGGLIYSGPGQPADGSMPALSVNVEGTPAGHDWSVHT
jgi:hypothetical protein